LIVLAVSGCAGLVPALEWTRIPEAPEYTVEEPIPLRVGIILEDVKPMMFTTVLGFTTKTCGWDVINEWEEMRLFDSLVYPYQEDDPIDAVMHLTTACKAEEEGGLSRFGVDMLNLATIGLTGIVAGRSATFTHEALAVINQFSNEIGQYSVQVATTIQLGKNPLKDAHGRNYVEGYDAGYELQRKRIAFELAKKIRADRQNLLSRLGKSQEETTAP